MKKRRIDGGGVCINFQLGQSNNTFTLCCYTERLSCLEGEDPVGSFGWEFELGPGILLRVICSLLLRDATKESFRDIVLLFSVSLCLVSISYY